MSEDILQPGDSCPCCGQPIKTGDPDMLLVLSWIAWMKGRQHREWRITNA